VYFEDSTMREKLDFRNAEFMSFLGVRIRTGGAGVPGGGMWAWGFWSIGFWV
jgi:hypothetical protein